MKKLLSTLLVLTIAAMPAVAARPAHSGAGPVAIPSARSGWHAGVDVGTASPLHNGPFFPQLRPTLGFNGGKFITPAFGLGLEGWWGINTSGWKGMVYSPTFFDNSYLGAFGTLDMISLFRGFSPARRFGVALSGGGGWGHFYRHGTADHNFFAAKVGAVFSLRLSPVLALRLQPSVLWNVSDARTARSSATLNGRRAVFHIQAGLSYCFGSPFDCILPYDRDQIDGLNGQINDLRRRESDANARAEAAEAEAARLRADLQAAASRPVVRQEAVDNHLNTVLDVFFHIGSSTVTRDQMPNVERIAAYLNNHPSARVDIKGYASRDGNPDLNRRLAQARAVAVKTILERRFKISPARITASGAGIGDLFEEDSWNRVSVCTLED